MSSYRWEVGHRCTEEVATDVLKNFGFEEDDLDIGLYTIQINSWNLLKARPHGKKLEFAFVWMGNETTEIYYDYLLNCGVLIGQIMRVLYDLYFEMKKEGQDVDVDEDDDEDDDDYVDDYDYVDDDDDEDEEDSWEEEEE